MPQLPEQLTGKLVLDRSDFTGGEPIRFTLVVANPTGQPLDFLLGAQGPPQDFTVTTATSGEPERLVWSSSEEVARLTVVQFCTISAGATLPYDWTWHQEWTQAPTKHPAPPGRYKVTGTLRSVPNLIAAPAIFTIH